MRRKALFLLLSLLLSVTLRATIKNVTVDNLTYTIDTEDDYAVVIGGGSEMTSIAIPSSITYDNDTYTVVGIADMAFHCRENITSVILPLTLRWIGHSSFGQCGITSINIPNSVRTIGSEAFGGCKSLVSVSLPESAVTIKYSAFSGCSNLISIKIPTGSTLESSVFSFCTSITSATIPKNTSLSELLFYGCTGLTSITIENKYTGVKTFYGCTSLSKVTFGDDCRSIDADCFYGCTNLTSFVVPDIIEKIDDGAFAYCSNLASLTLGKGLKTIGSGVNIRGSIVSGCDKLSKIIIPDIASWCNVDRTIYTGNNNHDLFYYGKLYRDDDTEIKDLIIPEGVTMIKKNVFQGCKNIESVSFANSVDSIEKWAFAECSSLTTLKIGSGLKYVGELAMGTNNITKLIIPDIASFCSLSLDNYNSLYGYDVGRHLYSDDNTEITDLVIPEGVTSIGDYIFHHFESITSLTLPNSLTTIGQYAFNKCTIKTIIVGKGLQSVGLYSFFAYHDYYPVDFYICAPTPPTADRQAFSNFGGNKTLHVPESALALYQEALAWKNFSSIVILQSGDPGYEAPIDNVTLTANNYTRQYGEANPVFDYAISEGTVTSGEPTITCSATATSPVGTYDIVIAKGTVGNETVNLVNGTLTITKAPLTISAGNYNKMEGEDNPTFTPTFSGFKNGETQSVLTKQPTVTTTATKASPAGTYPVTVSGAEAENYDISYKKGRLTVKAAAMQTSDEELKPLDEEDNVDFNNSESDITEETDLSNVIVDNIYYNIGVDAGGYSSDDKCIMITKETSDEQMTALEGLGITDEQLKENFTGIIFKVPAGSGNVTVTAETTGNMTLKVKVGNAVPMEMELSGKLKMKVPYDVMEETMVYIFAGMQSAARSLLRGGSEQSLKIYGIELETTVIKGDANADKRVNDADITEVANAIVGKPSANYNKTAADMDGNGTADIIDLTRIVKTVKSKH